MLPKKVVKYLDKNKAKYEIVNHRVVYTAHDLAMTLKIKHNQIAKNLLIKAGGDFVLAIMPADRNIDFNKFAKVVGVKKVSMPKEGVMKTKFKVHPGALPAFGGVNKLKVFVDKTMLKVKKAMFSGGSFDQSIQMNPKQYVKLEQAEVGSFSIIKKIKKVKITKSKKKKVKKISKKSKHKKKVGKNKVIKKKPVKKMIKKKVIKKIAKKKPVKKK